MVFQFSTRLQIIHGALSSHYAYDFDSMGEEDEEVVVVVVVVAAVIVYNTQLKIFNVCNTPLFNFPVDN